MQEALLSFLSCIKYLIRQTAYNHVLVTHHLPIYIYIYICMFIYAESLCLSVKLSQLFCSNIPTSLSRELTTESSYIRGRSRLCSQRHIMVNGHLKCHFIFLCYMKKYNSALTILIIHRLCPIS